MIKAYDFNWAKRELELLNPDHRFYTMLKSVAIATKLLEQEQVKPIIVGGFSVEIYTDEKYSTRDIDIVTKERNRVIRLFRKLGFEIDGRHLVHKSLELAIEFPDDELAGSYDKVNKILLDDNGNLYVYVISHEDIIMDRLRAYLYWGEDESKEWGLQMLALYADQLDKQYMITVGAGAETEQEAIEITKWLAEVSKQKSSEGN